MLVEHGFVRAQLPDGSEWTFTPSFGKIADLGDPIYIVRTFAELHDPARAATAAREVLAALCDQEDPTPLIGWLDESDGNAGKMPAAEQIIVARHLMQHGICGRFKREDGGEQEESGRYSNRFDAAEFISMARVHLELSSDEASALSMTELQQLMAAKFPTDAERRRKAGPSLDELEATERDVAAAEARRKERSGG